jgi:general secretion pathway protein G
MAENNEQHCQQCGALLLKGRRFCMVCQAPVAGTSATTAGQLAELARELPSTHRPDKTVVFVPELRDARLARERRTRRRIIWASLSCLVLLLAGITYWRVTEQKKAQAVRARRAGLAQRELDQYAKALDFFFADVGRYPTEKEGLNALLHRPPLLTVWRGPYMDGDYSVDPWGNEYVYHAFREGAGFELFTYGPEGEAAGRVFLRVHANAPEAAPPPGLGPTNKEP